MKQITTELISMALLFTMIFGALYCAKIGAFNLQQPVVKVEEIHNIQSTEMYDQRLSVTIPLNYYKTIESAKLGLTDSVNLWIQKRYKILGSELLNHRIDYTPKEKYAENSSIEIDVYLQFKDGEELYPFWIEQYKLN